MNRDERDIWAWTELVISMLSGIAIPLVLGYFSYQFRADQQKAQKTDRIRNSIELLASDSWRERAMGVRVLWHYCSETAQYPRPLISSLVRTMRTDPNPNVYREAASLFGTASRSSACHVQFQHASADPETRGRPSNNPSDSTRTQLYVHIQNADQKERARRIRGRLDTLSLGALQMNVVSIEQLQKGPSRSELRYFDPRQDRAARRLAEHAEQAAGGAIETRDFSTRYDTIPNHFELWLAPSSP